MTSQRQLITFGFGAKRMYRTSSKQSQIECLASFHGYLPLLQELLESSKGRDIFLITGYAGQYFSSQCLLLGFGF